MRPRASFFCLAKLSRAKPGRCQNGILHESTPLTRSRRHAKHLAAPYDLFESEFKRSASLALQRLYAGNKAPAQELTCV